jgi:hypothetical protein
MAASKSPSPEDFLNIVLANCSRDRLGRAVWGISQTPTTPRRVTLLLWRICGRARQIGRQ